GHARRARRRRTRAVARGASWSSSVAGGCQTVLWMRPGWNRRPYWRAAEERCQGPEPRFSALEAGDAGPGVGELETVAVPEGVGELLLVGDEQDTAEVATQVLQLLDHGLPAFPVQAAEPLVDDDRFDRPAVPAGVLADAQSEAHGDAEALTAAQQT